MRAFFDLFFLALLVIVLGSAASAKDNGVGFDSGNGSPAKPTVTNKPTTTSTSSAASVSASVSGASANTAVVVMPTLTANPSAISNPNQTATISGGNSSVSVTNTSPSDVKVRNTPDTAVFMAAPSAVCIITGAGSVSMPGFGASLGAGKTDESCVARENARMLHSFGERQAAVQVLCDADVRVAKYVPACASILREHQEKAHYDKLNERSARMN
ncbi:MAG: hypothetical protein E6Q97_33965 [Desulfurellales bacterium]|nr:MAG: hypothetical protein E6Q97_33965 [Desulfurellales bacterium]